MIYFMQAVDGGPVKIGFTDNLKTRHYHLERHYGTQLEILATMNGGREREREIHEQFSHLRLGRTEQFKPSSDLMAFIGCPLLVDPNPDAVEAMPGKRYGTLIRVSDEFAAAIRDASSFEKQSMAEFADAHLLQIVKKRYRDAVIKAAKKLEEG